MRLGVVPGGERDVWSKLRSLASRVSDWAVFHPFVWSVSAGVALALIGLALDLPAIVITAAGATAAVLNIIHAKKRGYCPVRAKSQQPTGERNTDRPAPSRPT